MNSMETLRQILGLRAEDKLEEVSRDHAPPAAVGHGFTASAALPLEELLSRKFVGHPHFLEVDTGGSTLFETRRWSEDAGVFAVRPGDAAIDVVSGRFQQIDDDVVVDARVETALVRALAFGREQVARLTRDEVVVYEVTRAPPTALRELERAVPEPLDLQAPSLDELMDGFPTAAWLAKEVGLLASSPSSLDRVSAVGLVARCWTPTGSPARGVLDAVLAGTLTPHDRAVAWVRTLDGDLVAELERLAVNDAIAAAEDAEALVDLAAEPEATLAAAVRGIAHRRDDLDSIALLLHAAGVGTRLDDALRDLDRTAAGISSVFACIAPLRDARLEEVAWRDPDAWWGALTKEA
jgi:hypothetical protein